MKIYILPYRADENDSLNISLGGNFLEVHYKTARGPLGFSEDETGRELFRVIVDGCFWYSAYNGNIVSMTSSYLAANRMIAFDGLFLMPTEFISLEIRKEEDLMLNVEKNKVLKKYNKPLNPENMSFFTDLFDRGSRKYGRGKIDELLRLGVEILIGVSDSLGPRFLMSSDSVFLQRLMFFCNAGNIPLQHVVEPTDIPAW